MELPSAPAFTQNTTETANYVYVATRNRSKTITET